MLEFEVLVEGCFHPADIVARYQPGLTMPADEAKAIWIEGVWQRSLARAQAQGVPLYDGKLFRLAGFRVEGSRLILVLGDTSYKEYVGTRQPEFHSGRRREQLANPLAVCAAIVTADRKILVERRQGLDVYSGRYHVIGGFFERDKDHGGAPHPVKAIRREVREETGLTIDREAFRCLGLVYDLITPHPELCFASAVDVTFAEVGQRRGTDGEVKRLEFVDDSEEALRDFILQNHGNISATGEPCLLLYGLWRFGRDWYDGLLAELYSGLR